MESNKKELDKSKKVFITGGAGFIGFHLSKSLLNKGCHVIGLDNLNDYYEVKLKMDRLKILRNHDNYKFYKDDLSDKERLNFIFSEERPDIVVNLGAQAGVRYSIDKSSL